MKPGLIVIVLLSIMLVPAEVHPFSLFNRVDEKYSKDEKTCRELLKKDPDNCIAMAQLAEMHLNSGNRKYALKWARKAIKADPEYPFPHYYTGKIQYLNRKYNDSLESFDVFEEKMDAYVKKNAFAKEVYIACLHYMAKVNYSLKNYKSVIKCNNKILSIDPRNQRAHYNLAVCYYNHLHKTSQAYIELNKVIEIDSDRALSNKAEFFIDYMRNNPDSRYSVDIEFIERG